MSKLVTLPWSDGKVYFFNGDSYVRWDVASDAVESGYPRQIDSGWRGVWSDGFDSAALWNNGKAYFFKDEEYLAYDVAADAVDDGYPKLIADNWPGLFTESIDAVVVWNNGKAYFFSGDEYLSYDVAADAVDEGYPKPISEGWAMPFDSDLDSVVLWNNGKAYVFSGSDYVRYDVGSDRADEGFPQPISSGWPGVLGEPVATQEPASKPAPNGTSSAGSEYGVHASVRDSFMKFSVPLEGPINHMYVDVKGYVTTGVGNLIDTEVDACKLPWVHADSSTASADEVRAEWQLIKTTPGLPKGGANEARKLTKLHLTQQAIDDLVFGRFDANTKVLRRAYPEWDTWPADAQLGCHSILWAGAHFPDPKYWPSFTAAALARDWAAAADQSKLKDNAKRSAANAHLFNNAARVEAEGLDISVLLYPN